MFTLCGLYLWFPIVLLQTGSTFSWDDNDWLLYVHANSKNLIDPRHFDMDISWSIVFVYLDVKASTWKGSALIGHSSIQQARTHLVGMQAENGDIVTDTLVFPCRWQQGEGHKRGDSWAPLWLRLFHGTLILSWGWGRLKVWDEEPSLTKARWPWTVLRSW